VELLFSNTHLPGFLLLPLNNGGDGGANTAPLPPCAYTFNGSTRTYAYKPADNACVAHSPLVAALLLRHEARHSDDDGDDGNELHATGGGGGGGNDGGGCGGGGSLVAAVAGYYRLLLLRASSQHRHLALSLLTFNTPLLPCLWHWLAYSIGKPLNVDEDDAVEWKDNSAVIAATASASSSSSSSSSSSPSSSSSSSSLSPTKKRRWFFRRKKASTARHGQQQHNWHAWLDALLTDDDDDARASARRQRQRTVFAVFLHAYQHALLALEDDEFAGSCVPFPSPPHLRAFTRMLKVLVFSLLWRGGGGGGGDDDNSGDAQVRVRGTSVRSAAAALLSSSLAILGELHRRDGRTQFMPEGGWVLQADENYRIPSASNNNGGSDNGSGGGASGGVLDEWRCEWEQWLALRRRPGAADATDAEDAAAVAAAAGTADARVARLLVRMHFLAPFDERLRLFRQRVDADRARWSSGRGAAAEFVVRIATSCGEVISCCYPNLILNHCAMYHYYRCGARTSSRTGSPSSGASEQR
jgi:hypothetical protein